MARTAYWVIDLASYTAPTNAEIRQGQRTGGATALVSGSEAFAAISGSGTITEATTVTTLSAGTQYRLSWTIYDDVAANYPASAPQHYVWTYILGATAESLSLVDSQVSSATFVVSDAESVVLADSQVSRATFVVTRSESLSLADSQVSSATFVVSDAESVVLADSQTGVVSVAGVNTTADTIGLSDSFTVRVTYVVAQPETVTLVDSSTVRTTYPVAQVESIALSHTQTGTTPTVHTGTVSESIGLSHTQTGTTGVLPIARFGHFGDPKQEGIKEAERAMIQLEDEFILEIVLSLAVKGALVETA